MISRFLTDHITLERLVTRDEFEGTTYAPPRSIPARLNSKTQVVRGDAGREITSSAHVTVTVEIKPGDRVTDIYGIKREVVTVQINKHTDGRFSHRVAYLA
jgi:hypothetical protein